MKLSILLFASAPVFCATLMSAADPSSPTPVRLSVNEAVVRALDTNLEISIERLKPEMAEQRRRYALGALDPRVDVSMLTESLETPQNTRDFFATGRAVEVLNEDNVKFEGALGGTLPTGTRYSITVRSYRLKNSLNREALARYYPEYTTNTSFTLTQPLLRGFGPKATLTEANIARAEKKSAEETLRGRLDEVAASVVDAYVEAQYGRELVRVITDRIALAERLKSENEKRLKEGLMGPIDVLQAESTKASAEIELARATAFQKQAENRLRELIFADFTNGVETALDLTDPLAETSITESAASLRNYALERSAEYRVAQQKVDTEKIRVRYARNQFLPRVDLQASVGASGLGNDVSGGFKDYWQREEPDYTVGVVASLPITFRQERARLRQSLLDLRTAEYDLKRTGNRIVAQVQNAYNRVEAAQARTESAAKAVASAQATLDAEEKRLANGLTTSFAVLRMQDQLAQARVNRLEAIAEGQKAAAVLWGVIGNLLDKLQIQTIEAPGALKRS